MTLMGGVPVVTEDLMINGLGVRVFPIRATFAWGQHGDGFLRAEQEGRAGQG